VSNTDHPSHAEENRRGHANIQTGSGAYIDGNPTIFGKVNQLGGTMGDVTIIEADKTYDVRGLPNPYLGLKSFSYDERHFYAGREVEVNDALKLLTTSDTNLPILFITGASGSGKSSFAQAGLLPALQEHYEKRGYTVNRAIIRPSTRPLAQLRDGLMQLHLFPDQGFIASPQNFSDCLAKTPERQINLILIDQFEEVFTQADLAEKREAFLALLSNLPPFEQSRTLLLATLRVDYLKDLFNYPVLYDLVKAGIELRSMTVDELQASIQQPLHLKPDQLGYNPAYKGKSFEPELVERLTEDATEDATYLPLLQVTLEEMWKGGWLKLSAYHSLSDAIQQRADTVLAHQLDREGNPNKPRPAEEQQQILDLLLELVNVSPDDEPRPDVRRRRLRSELEQASPIRLRLIDELATARLLAASNEQRGQQTVEVVDIIHESLIVQWERLREAIEDNRELLRRRARLRQALRDWLQHDKSDKYLLVGVALEEARELQASQDGELHDKYVQELFDRSITKQKARQRRQLQTVVGIAAVLLVLSIVVGVAAMLAVDGQNKAISQKNEVERQKSIESLTTTASNLLSVDPELSLLLSLEASNKYPKKEDISAQLKDVMRQGLADFRLLQTLYGHNDKVTKAVFSPDNKFIATTSWDKKAIIWSWDGSNAYQLYTIQDHTSGILDVAINQDSSLIVTASDDKTAKIWSWDGKKATSQAILHHDGAVNSVAFNAAGDTIITSSDDKTIKIWNTDGTLRNTLQGHTDAVRSAKFNPDGTLIVSASNDKTVKIWDVKEGKVLQTLGDYDSVVYYAEFSPNGKTIATSGASWNKSLRLWNVENIDSPQIRLTLPGHGYDMYSISFSPNGFYIVTAGSENRAKVWDTRNGQLVYELLGHASGLNYAQFDSTSRYILTASDDNTAKIWDVQFGGPTVLPVQTCCPVRSAAFSLDGKTVVLASQNDYVSIWNTDAATRIIEDIKAHSSGINSIRFNRQGNLFLTASWDGTVKIWSWDGKVAQQQAILNDTSTASDSKSTAEFSPDEKFILTTGWNVTAQSYIAKIWSWDGSNAKELYTLQSKESLYYYNAIFSPDGKFIITTNSGGKVKVWSWDGKSANDLFTIETNASAVNDAIFSIDNKTIITAQNDGTATIWDWDGAKATSKHVLRGHSGGVNSVAVSPDGLTVLTASDDKTAKLWDIKTGTLIGSLPGHSEALRCAVFSPDGKMIVTTSDDGTAQIHNLDIDELLTKVRTRVTRVMTREERTRYGLNPDDAKCSIEVDKPTSAKITFFNDSKQSISVYWVNQKCQLFHYATISPGNQYIQNGTVTTDIWQVRDTNSGVILKDGMAATDSNNEVHIK
jgi:WD40 repeat protein